MKPSLSTTSGSCARDRRRRGFAASVIVLALVAVMAALLLGISRTVAALDRELRLVEQRQLEKYPTAPASPAP